MQIFPKMLEILQLIEKKLDLIDVFEIFVDEKRVSPFKNSD